MRQVPKALIQEIVGQLQAGFRCFLHKEALELISFPDEDEFASFDPGMWREEIQDLKNVMKITSNSKAWRLLTPS